MRRIERNGCIFQVNDRFPFRRYFGSSASKAKAPKSTSPAATVRSIDEDVKQKDRDRRRQRIAAAGRGGTILTEGQPLGQSATLLGRSSS